MPYLKGRYHYTSDLPSGELVYFLAGDETEKIGLVLDPKDITTVGDIVPILVGKNAGQPIIIDVPIGELHRLTIEHLKKKGGHNLLLSSV